ncbi:hypothetical protein [Salinicola tamaricis]|uniref:hypothetical protein n=1 Tax=Salinicola tamaricis TaxID=1771309 RepID=UPI000D0A34E3|nr:hypothetical protein [Salinicola tamaricis]
MRIGDREMPDAGRRLTPGTSEVPAPRERQTPADGDFTHAVDLAQQRRGQRPALRQQLAALASPVPSDPASFSPARSLDLLQHVVDSVLPRLDADAATLADAATILGEEIAWRQAWENRLHAPLAGERATDGDTPEERS